MRAIDHVLNCAQLRRTGLRAGERLVVELRPGVVVACIDGNECSLRLPAGIDCHGGSSLIGSAHKIVRGAAVHQRS